MRSSLLRPPPPSPSLALDDAGGNSEQESEHETLNERKPMYTHYVFSHFSTDHAYQKYKLA